MKRRLHFWKPLRLPLLGKSRVIEIFHASKIFYAANFYPIPPDAVKGLTDAFIDYITFPKKKKNEVSKREMEKLREYGGIKLINLQLKSETPKIHWLVRMTTDPNLRIHLSIFDALIGEQIGQLRARDIIFTEKSYIKMCKFKNTFYREAFQGIAKLNTFKHMSDLNDEHLFYNPIFTTTTSEEDMHDTTLTPFRGNRILSGIRTYGDLIAAETTLEDPRLTAAVRRKKHSIHHIRENVDSDLIMGLNDGKPIKFKYLTQKIIYSELLHEQSTDHPYKTKWALEREGLDLIDWDQVWDSIHVGTDPYGNRYISISIPHIATTSGTIPCSHVLFVAKYRMIYFISFSIVNLRKLCGKESKRLSTKLSHNYPHYTRKHLVYNRGI